MRTLLAFPIAALRTRSRRAGTYLIRLLACCLAMLLVLQAQQSGRFGARSAPGLELLAGVAWLNLVLVLLASGSYFSSVITEEKEQGTMGLLRMTPLSSLSVLLGKSTNRLFGALGLLMVQVPFLVLAVTLGGVSLHQVFAVFLGLLAFVVVVANVALVWSVLCGRNAAASRATVITLLAAGGLQLAANIWLDRFGYITAWPLLDRMLTTSIFRTLGQVPGVGWSGGVMTLQAGRDLGLGIVFFLLAWMAYGRYARDATAENVRRPGLLRRMRGDEGAGSGPSGGNRLIARRLAVFSPGRCWKNAILWKDYHFVAGGRLGIVLKFALAIGGCALVFAISLVFGDPVIELDFYAGLLFVGGLLLAVVEVPSGMGRMLNREWRWGTLQAQALLPFSMVGLVVRKAAAQLLALIPNAMIVIAGAVLAPHLGEDFIKGLVDPVAWGMFAAYVFFVQLNVTLSLYLKRGAILVAVLVAYLVSMLGMALAVVFLESVMTELTFPLFIIGGYGLCTVLLNVKMFQRLRILAARD